MEQQQLAAALEGRPHAAELFRPLDLLCWVCAVCVAAVLFFKGTFDAFQMMMTGIAVIVPASLWLALALKRRAVCRWRWDNGVLYFTRGAFMRGETAFRTDRLLYAETLRSPFVWLLGGMRVRLYAEAAERVVFSAVLPRQEADALLKRLMASEKSGEGPQGKNITSGRYAALPSAMTDIFVLMLLFGAAVMALAGAGRFLFNTIAIALWMGAFLRFIERLLSEAKLSVNRTDSGWMIVRGIGGCRRLYIPDRSIIGIRESSTLVALLCGARRVEWICGGRRIPCMRWYVSSRSSVSEDENASSPACDLLGCVGNAFVVLKNAHAVRKRYFFIGIGAICSTVLVSFADLPSVRDGDAPEAIATLLFIGGVTGVLLQCFAGMNRGKAFGMAVSPSCVRASGMGLLTEETLTLRRGCLSEVRVNRTPSDRVNGLCTLELIPKGCRRGIKCRCMPYDRVQALLERFG